MKFGFKIHLDDIAEKLTQKGFSSQDVDSDKFITQLVEILEDEYNLLSELSDKLESLEDINHPEPETLEDYLEKIGEI
jgi:flagellar biosynthesis chaperone FliJ